MAMAAGSRHTVFGRALQAGSLHWSDDHLQRILASDSYSPNLTGNGGSDKPTFDPQGRPLWLGEPFPTTCARVDTLRAHGYPRQALRLASAIVNTLRLQQRHQLQIYKQQKKGGHQSYHRVLGLNAKTANHVPSLGCLSSSHLDSAPTLQASGSPRVICFHSIVNIRLSFNNPFLVSSLLPLWAGILSPII